ncbi:hypothetical protein SAMN05661012_00885 [Chitinophaga sancti]|uniref:Uncharacterized protein n=1 Tax=Chitinophaga sancti TaxID=1004 RepID=A0A1K1MTZ8_9BACT|nr:hypothetical protein SAMN05661012_00885 [Chitinophaga sancti]
MMAGSRVGIGNGFKVPAFVAAAGIILIGRMAASFGAAVSLNESGTSTVHPVNPLSSRRVFSFKSIKHPVLFFLKCIDSNTVQALIRLSFFKTLSLSGIRMVHPAILLSRMNASSFNEAGSSTVQPKFLFSRCRDLSFKNEGSRTTQPDVFIFTFAGFGKAHFQASAEGLYGYGISFFFSA